MTIVLPEQTQTLQYTGLYWFSAEKIKSFGTWSKGARVFGFLSSLALLPQPARQCLGPTCHLSTLNYHCIADSSSPIHVIGEVSFEPNM